MLFEGYISYDVIIFIDEFSSENKYGLPRRPYDFHGYQFVETQEKENYGVIYVCFTEDAVDFSVDAFMSVNWVLSLTFFTKCDWRKHKTGYYGSEQVRALPVESQRFSRCV